MKNKHLCIWNPNELIKWKKLFSKLTDTELCIQKGLFVFPDQAKQMKNKICSNSAIKLKICEQRKKKIDYENFKVIMPEYIYNKIIDYYDKLFKRQLVERNIVFQSEIFGTDIEITDFKIRPAKNPFPMFSLSQPSYSKEFIYVVSGHNHPYSYFRTGGLEKIESLGTCESYLFLSEDDIDVIYTIYDDLLDKSDIELDFWIEIIFVQYKKNIYSKKAFGYLKNKFFEKEFNLLETNKHYFVVMAFIIPFVYYDTAYVFKENCSTKNFMIDLVIR
ncbi:MAG: hypothetical protein QXO40_04330 [Candidatus Aenigmatarchaeota archaeon]